MSSAYWVGVRIETAMSLVTWSPAIGMTAVWRIAPLAKTARSVVPPPMSTRHTPSSFSSSVRTAKAEASCSSTTSSTSSPQRWMDCTVDSMLTTTPFFSPREGCEPSPRSSIEPSGATSPTSATTLEVPISSPTIRFLSARLSIVATVPARGAGGIAAPADGKPVCVAHIHVGNVLAALRDELQRRVHEFLEALVHLAPSQTHGDAVGKIEFPGAACIQAHRGEAQAGLRETSFRGQIALRHQ